MKIESLDTIYSNINLIDKFNSAINKSPEDVKSGKIALGAKGDRLVSVSNSTSIFTRIINFFRGISTDPNVVGKVINASQEALVNDERLMVIADKIARIVKNSKDMNAKLNPEQKDFLVRFYSILGC